jgi:site-specific recombinase XerD
LRPSASRFFAANLNNDNTRRAYARACAGFFAWCEVRGLALANIRPFDVAAWVKQLQEKYGAAGVKQQLAAVRMLFDWLVVGQVVPMNPAATVRGPKLVVKTGKTPVLEADESQAGVRLSQAEWAIGDHPRNGSGLHRGAAGR